MTTETLSPLAVGEPITTREQLAQLPIGAMVHVTNNPVRTYVKEDLVGNWRRHDGALQREEAFTLSGYNTLTSLPEGVDLRRETPDQYAWRFCDTMMAICDVRGGYQDEVLRAMDDVGDRWSVERFPWGTGMVIRSTYFRNLLPVGSTLAIGRPDNTAGRFGYYLRTDTGWERRLGSRGLEVQREAVVNLVAGRRVEQEWLTANGTEQTDRDLIRWKAKMWNAGLQIKREHQWCDDYDNYVRTAGLDRSAVQAAQSLTRTDGLPEVGTTVNPDQAYSLPEGTVLRWRSADRRNGCQQWFVRDGSVSNRARTRRVMGWRDDGVPLRSYMSTMEVVGYPDLDMSIEMPVRDDIFAMLPVGTLFEYTGSRFVVTGDHGAANADGDRIPEVGTWRQTAFDTTRCHIVRFGAAS